MRIVATINNFWIGGRETFLTDFAKGLAQMGVKVDLWAGSLNHGMSSGSPFQSQRQPASPTVAGFLGEDWDGETGMVWGQHFDLLEAWVLSRARNVPMHTTFHGPLVGAGRPNSHEQALGMTLALCRAEGHSAVSEETAESIRLAAPHAPEASIVRNATVWSDRGKCGQPVANHSSVLFATRAEKLGHTRAAMRLFVEGRRRGLFRCLTIVAAQPHGASPIEGGWAAAARLLGREWCLRSGPATLLSLLCTRVFCGTSDLSSHFAKSEVVFGMGRVVIEALAAGKPAVLLGYEDVTDVVDGSNFSIFAKSNFSGRGIQNMPLGAILQRLAGPRPEIPEQSSAEYEIGEASRHLARIFSDTVALPVCDLAFGREIASAALAGASKNQLCETVCQILSPEEKQTLHRLEQG